VDHWDPYNEVIFARRTLDYVVLDWTSKVISVWNSSARQIKREITENGKNLEQVFNVIFLSEASKK
jgi:hypothetical protein